MADEVGSVLLNFERDHFAERLRVRKGQTVRYTMGGVATDYRVTKVLMPDENGNVVVRVALA